MEPNDELLGYVRASKNRTKILKTLAKHKITPAELSKKIGMLQTNTSKILKELVAKKLIRCTTHGLRKGKLFELTEDGYNVLKTISSS